MLENGSWVRVVANRESGGCDIPLLTLQVPRMWKQRKGHSQDRRTIEFGQMSRDSLSDGSPEIAGVLDLGDAPRFGLLLYPMWFRTTPSNSRRSVQN